LLDENNKPMEDTEKTPAGKRMLGSMTPRGDLCHPTTDETGAFVPLPVPEPNFSHALDDTMLPQAPRRTSR
jgi:hypothetical protein